ncbi:hypothetical protein IV52_GL000538 [Fructilactobacillus lindneri DSM 20690 = JCM 11027]|uniref:Uncharacterized protein n=1 Tax=Fructilactobacillus lindneri DSM 20690 = JCM 11027 TaxID=1122148 RepID=A0A0R2JVU2_9LACO|nr:hypothetical protein IV52_GL000538 [Fructilactobacillus lindneri DSM 20690 = JCM 11027]SJZ74608.1 hypothetical protein SAMN02746042_00250 [Fructilactobacillus lindneri DSM 20690 = JCM 11027]
MFIILAMCITIVINTAITVFAFRINADFMTKFLFETEDRFDKKLKLKESINNKCL